MAGVPLQILLSTFNGARWLPELLASLLQQTFQDWQLLVRDDASTDDTMQVLLQWQAQHPAKVCAILRDGINLGSTQSFSRLVTYSHAPYLLFCDQDDVWFPEKVEMQYTALRRLEAQYGTAMPLLVHSDVAVVDPDKNLLMPSLWEYRHFDVQQRKQAYLLTNVVTGCATAFNRAAAARAFPAPLYAMQHDRWLALVCAYFGQIVPQPQPLLLYRQHAANSIGAAPASLGGVRTRVEAWSRQAEAFLYYFSEYLSAEDYQAVAAVAGLRHVHGWQRRQHILNHRLFKSGALNNLALLLFA